MKTKAIVCLVLLAALLAACSQEEEPTATPMPPTATIAAPTATTPPTEVPPTAEPTAVPEPTAAPEPETAPPTTSIVDQIDHVPDPQLVNVVWQWERRDPNGNQSAPIEVPNPEAYTLFFQEDGTFAATLDCNNANGRYATNTPGSIFMELGGVTMAACGEQSLADEMSQMFGPAQSYRFEEEGQVLVFAWAAGGPLDYFRNAAGLAAGDSDEPSTGAEEIGGIAPDAISLSLGGLAESFTWSVQPGFPPSPGPGGLGMPPHIVLTFDGETLTEVGENNGRRLYIFPRAAYENIAGEQVTSQVNRLETLIGQADTRPALPDNPMPVLPPPSSFMDRWVQFLDLDFGVGTGVRYVSDSPSRQQVGPWSNDTMAYYYQGLTGDGVFYVSLYWPVSTASLPDTQAEVPADVADMAGNPDTYSDYLQQTKDELNALSPADWSPDLVQLDTMISSLTFQTTAAPSLTGQTWAWVSTTDPLQQTLVDDPSRYTITFNENGEAAIVADCNNVMATYTTVESEISIILGPSQLAACGEASLDQEFLSSLEAAVFYFFQQGDLFMDMFADSGTMRFQAQTEVVESEPETPSTPEGEDAGQDTGPVPGTITAPDGVFVRTGPGSEFPPVATLAFDESVEIVGQSEDGQWWVIDWPISEEVPTGQAWVSASFVETTASDMPVVETPDIETSLTGTLWNWQSLQTPVDNTTVPDPSQYTILFEEPASVQIQADCNAVGGTYSADDSSLMITLQTSTAAACGDASLDQLFLTSLSNAAGYFFEDGDLYIDQMADAGTMRFSATSPVVASPTPAPDPASPTGGAVGITFNLLSFGPEGSEQAVLAGTQITAVFSQTDVSGSAGCNDYSGTLTPVNDYFTVSNIVTTLQSCAEPAGIMEQEQDFLAALAGTTGFLWQEQLANGTTLVTAGQLFYTLSDGSSGVMNFIAAP